MASAMRRSIDFLCRTLVDLVIPRHCAACGQAGDVLCGGCGKELDRHAPLRRVAVDGVPPVVALGSYEGALRRAVLSAKFRSCSGIATIIGHRLAAYIDWQIDGIVPVPLHPLRMQERGYNQSARLAVAIGAQTGVTCIDGAIERIRHTRPQSRLDLTHRTENVAGAFARGLRARAVRGLRVLLVDDVLTTGATASACSSALLEAGAAVVYLACAAIRL